jgi:hypothetical protein
VAYQSPDIKTLIHEVVNRGDWANGNDLAIIVTGTAGSLRRAWAYGSGTPAKLHIECSAGGTPAVTNAVAEISPTDVTTSSTGNSFSYDIQATISGAATGVDTVAITVPGAFGAPTVTDVLDDGVSVPYTNNTTGNAISVDITTKITASSKITVLFDSDAPGTQDLTGVDFTSTVDDSGTGDAAQSTTEGNGDGDAGDANTWTVTTTDASLVGHWPFNEGSGQTAGDVSGNSNNATLGNTAGADSFDPSWACVDSSYALDFDGVDDYLAITDPGGAWDLGDGGLDVGTGDFSIAAWVIFDSVGADGFPSIMFKGGGSSTNAGYWYGHETSVDGLRLAVSDGTNRFIANSNPALGLDDTNWHHVTVVFDREAGTDTAYFYLDGTPVGSEASALIAGNSATGTNDVGIGASATGTRPWKGSIDDPRIYDYALSAGEITALAASAPGRPRSARLMSPRVPPATHSVTTSRRRSAAAPQASTR